MSKKFAFMLVMCLIMVSAYIPTYASDVQTISASSTDTETRRGDVYVYKYRWINGIQYRRLWNATKGEWAEPYWSPCP